MTHEEARDLMPLFVVDADDRQTREALLAHLAGCEACREALQEFGLAADAIGQSVPQVRPRPELRTRTLAAILGADHPQGAMPARFPAPQMRSREVPAAIAVPARAGWAPWLAAAAAILAAVSIGGLWQTRGQLAEMRTTLALWQARVAEAERSAQTAQTTLVARPKRSSAPRRTPSSSRPATCRRCRRRRCISCGPSRMASRSAPEPSCPMRAAASSWSRTYRR